MSRNGWTNIENKIDIKKNLVKEKKRQNKFNNKNIEKNTSLKLKIINLKILNIINIKVL